MSEFRCESQLKCTLKCALDISCFDMDVYAVLLKNNPASVEELVEILQKDRSTVYKSLQNLLEKGLVEREYRILRGGGYKYLYKPIPFEKFKEEILKNIKEWANKLIDALEEIEKLSKEEIEDLLITPRT